MVSFISQVNLKMAYHPRKTPMARPVETMYHEPWETVTTFGMTAAGSAMGAEVIANSGVGFRISADGAASAAGCAMEAVAEDAAAPEAVARSGTLLGTGEDSVWPRNCTT